MKKVYILTDNFYFIYFKNIQIINNDMDIKKIFLNGKKETLQQELDSYNKMTNNKERFEKYWTYIPSDTSFLHLSLIGLIETSLRYNFNVFHIDIHFGESQELTCRSIFDLFDNKFKHIRNLEAVFMFRIKNKIKYTIIFITSHDNFYEFKNHSQALLYQYDNDLPEIHGLENFKYNFNVPKEYSLKFKYDFNEIDDFRVVDIQINSLVIGLYTRNSNYCIILSYLLGGDYIGLFNYDYINSNPLSHKYKTNLFDANDFGFIQYEYGDSVFLFIR